MTIDPLARWRPLPDKPDYAGFLSFGGAPIAQEPAHLEGNDVAIVDAPMDDLVSDRPGTRFAPRAIRAASCPPGPHLEAGIDAFAELRIVDYGDAPVLPADPMHSHEAISKLIGEVVDAGVVPVTLGGDHSITEPCVSAVAARRGPVGLIHFDTHTDTGREVFGIERSHGTPMFRLVEAGAVAGARYAQIGLRGYWPGPVEFEWQRGHGIASVGGTRDRVPRGACGGRCRRGHPDGSGLGGHHGARGGARRARAAYRSRSAKLTRSNGQHVATHSRTASSSTWSRPSSYASFRTQSFTRTSCASVGFR
jgi:hypothetical protein